MTEPNDAPDDAVETGAVEPLVVEGQDVACDGGGGALGHPRVFLTFDTGGRIDCPYCGRKFERQPGGPGSH